MTEKLSHFLSMPEKDCVERLLGMLDWDDARGGRVYESSVAMIEAMRSAKRKAGSVESFFQSYGLSTKEGLSLMSLAEALLRIPDAKTADALIRDKIAGTNWGDNASAAGQDWMMRIAEKGLSASRKTLSGPLAKIGAPVIRKAMTEGMKSLGGQFVIGETVAAALKNAADIQKDKPYLFSYDMLGEGARTKDDAGRYFKTYESALHSIGTSHRPGAASPPGLSVKLSALHPRYSFAKEKQCVPDLVWKLNDLCEKAASYGICLTVDAEESERLETSLKIIRTVIENPSLRHWQGFGLAVQAYDKRAPYLIDTLSDWARINGRKIQVRLVKGAYWDSEIKRAQIKGLDTYPVYTRKIHTDLAYLACAQKLLAAREYVYPMFGTHNAYTVCAILDMAGIDKSGFEFQRLFGMGGALYDRLTSTENIDVRIYAPVGKHRELLPYLVRRLLENGANSSFVNKAMDKDVPPEMLAADPYFLSGQTGGEPHPAIQTPRNIYRPRANSKGFDLDDSGTIGALFEGMEAAFEKREVAAACIIDGTHMRSGIFYDVYNPGDVRERIGTAYCANEYLVEKAAQSAFKAFPEWTNTDAKKRAAILNAIADEYERHASGLLMLCMREAGKTLSDAVAELREAVDFCRYYAALGEAKFSKNGEILDSYTGESNKILLQGKGVFVCISPWNFPLAIFTGQIVAALMAGNTVLAKPAEQTPFVAQCAIRLMHKAGVPQNVLHLVTGDAQAGELLTMRAGIAGVAFTGSTGAAWAINRMLAAKDGPIVPFIAETGGLNAMIMDSSALPEQVVDDVVLSAFGSAGQRCSACRVVFLQDDVADHVIDMLKGAMAELTVGDPRAIDTDIGPVIDEEALAVLQQHKTALEGFAKFVAQTPLPDDIRSQGHYFAPVAYEIRELSQLKKEVFGPLLHIVRYRENQLPEVLQSINDSGFGLTFGLHTRLDRRIEELQSTVNVGNVYINRSITGAVVGVQPFGGTGLSGTGPKAGGPHYLYRFATEKTISVNTTAAGGNASLATLND